MAMSDYSLSDIAAVSDGNGLGGAGNGGWWILLLFILLGGWNSNGPANVGGNELYPWMENQQNIANGFSSAEIAAANRQMATQQQFAECCCENRLATANLNTTIQAEGAANRAAIQDQTQRILDQLCQDKIDAKNDEIAQLRTQINVLNLAASQNQQTAAILADNAAQTNALEQYLAPTPRPAYVVQNPNCCTAYNGCTA